MSNDDKFARIAALRPARKKEAPDSRASGVPAEGDYLAQLLGARLNRNRFGEHLSVKQWYATTEMCAPDERSVSLLLPQSDATGASARASADPEQWLFLDTETTGLAGGTGTYAFLVGIAWWDAGGLQIEQFFMRDLDEEHSLLLELSERMAQRPVLLTFNGKSFDWPLLETRYRMTRSVAAFAPKAHLDLLHPSRQLWRLRLGTVRLQDLERHVLPEHSRSLDWSRDGDIDSSLIPQMYFDYLRGGPAEPIVRIFQHNQMDLRGLAALAGRLFAVLSNGIGIADAGDGEARNAIEILGLSRLLRRRGHSARAREHYETALHCGLPRTLERLAQRELAQLAKREQDYARANSLWDALRQAPRSSNRSEASLAAEDFQRALETAIEAAEQLAIYYEHHAKQPRRALDLVRMAVSELREAQQARKFAMDVAATIEVRLLRRLARLERRCTSNPLFGHSGAANHPFGAAL
jgi:uncharacterized protein